MPANKRQRERSKVPDTNFSSGTWTYRHTDTQDCRKLPNSPLKPKVNGTVTKAQDKEGLRTHTGLLKELQAVPGQLRDKFLSSGTSNTNMLCNPSTRESEPGRSL